MQKRNIRFSLRSFNTRWRLEHGVKKLYAENGNRQDLAWRFCAEDGGIFLPHLQERSCGAAAGSRRSDGRAGEACGEVGDSTCL